MFMLVIQSLILMGLAYLFGCVAGMILHLLFGGGNRDTA